MTTAVRGEAYCRCGDRRYPSMEEARAVERSGLDKCPRCGTFALDHPFWGDEASDWRCYDCDTRSGSHGGPR